MHTVIQFSLVTMSVIFYRVFSSGSINVFSEQLRMIVFLSTEKIYVRERSCKICRHLHLFAKRCKLEELNFEVTILYHSQCLLIYTVNLYCFLASLQLGCQVGLGTIPH